MATCVEDSSLVQLSAQRDLQAVVKILEARSAGAEDVKVFGRVQKDLDDRELKLRKVFQAGIPGVSTPDRLVSARTMLGEGLFILSVLEPPLVNFKESGIAVHIGEPVRNLRGKLREFRELIEEKEEQRRQILTKLTSV